MSKYYTYIHKLNNTNEVFYVGVAQRVDRLLSLRGRSKNWHDKAKQGWSAEIVKYHDTDLSACLHEQELIDYYLSLKQPLVNIDRNVGSTVRQKWTQEMIRERFTNLSNSGKLGGKVSSETKAIAARLNGAKGGRPRKHNPRAWL